MIHDTLENFSRYAGLHPRFAAIAKWLGETDLQTLSLGRHEILANDEAFVNVQEIPVRVQADIPAEYHRKYIDVQIPLSGVEKMGWQPLAKFPADAPFSDEKGVALAESPTSDWVSVQPGEFVIFFPQDAHTPGLVEKTHKKIIIKVMI